MKKRLLLHTCCGPCAAWPLAFLTGDGSAYDPTGIFYNPNIHPLGEWRRRADAAAELYGRYGVPLITLGDYMEREWTELEARANEQPLGAPTASAHGAAPARDGHHARCIFCYRVRIAYTADEARRGGFDAFSTTLLISPYQNHALITRVCEEEAARSGVAFYYRDFRPHFREGQAAARELGLYRQKYCGCLFSLPPTVKTRSVIILTSDNADIDSATHGIDTTMPHCGIVANANAREYSNNDEK